MNLFGPPREPSPTGSEFYQFGEGSPLAAGEGKVVGGEGGRILAGNDGVLGAYFPFSGPYKGVKWGKLGGA